MICPNCSTNNPQWLMFCCACGEPLAEAAGGTVDISIDRAYSAPADVAWDTDSKSGVSERETITVPIVDIADTFVIERDLAQGCDIIDKATVLINERISQRHPYHRLAAEYYITRPLPAHPQSLADVQFLIAAFSHYLQAGDYLAAYSICEQVIAHDPTGSPLTFDEALDRWGESSLRRNLYLAVAPHLDGAAKVTALGRLATAHSHLSEYAEAVSCYHQAIELAAQLGDRHAEAHWLEMLGNLYITIGDFSAAIADHFRALELSTALNDPATEAKWLGNIATTYLASGDGGRAIPYLRQALELTRTLEDRRREGQLLGNLGSAYGTIGDASQAIACLSDALAIARELADHRGEMMRLGNLGVTCTVFGQTELAISCLSQALEQSRKLGDPLNEAIWLGNLGVAYGDCGDHHSSLACLTQAVDLSLAINDHWGQATWLGYLGNEYCTMGREAEAATAYETAINLTHDHDADAIEVVAESGVARLTARRGERAAALTRLQPLLENPPTRINELVALYYNAACTFALLDNCSVATSYLEQAARLNPAIRRRAVADPHLAPCQDMTSPT